VVLRGVKGAGIIVARHGVKSGATRSEECEIIPRAALHSIPEPLSTHPPSHSPLIPQATLHSFPKPLSTISPSTTFPLGFTGERESRPVFRARLGFDTGRDGTQGGDSGAHGLSGAPLGIRIKQSCCSGRSGLLLRIGKHGQRAVSLVDSSEKAQPPSPG
jgi:hypothetical protein